MNGVFSLEAVLDPYKEKQENVVVFSSPQSIDNKKAINDCICQSRSKSFDVISQLVRILNKLPPHTDKRLT